MLDIIAPDKYYLSKWMGCWNDGESLDRMQFPELEFCRTLLGTFLLLWHSLMITRDEWFILTCRTSFSDFKDFLIQVLLKAKCISEICMGQWERGETMIERIWEREYEREFRGFCWDTAPLRLTHSVVEPETQNYW